MRGAATATKPASPHTAPERAIVRTMTFLTLMPEYRAVFVDSPTTRFQTVLE